jgi:hypothetical protein
MNARIKRCYIPDHHYDWWCRAAINMAFLNILTQSNAHPECRKIYN